MSRFAIVVLIVAACRGKADGPPCPAVAGRFLAIARDELAKATVEPELRRAVADQLPAMRDSLDQLCEDSAWPAAVRECLAKADSHVAFEACEQQLDDAARRALDRAAQRAVPPSP